MKMKIYPGKHLEAKLRDPFTKHRFLELSSPPPHLPQVLLEASGVSVRDPVKDLATLDL